MLLLQKDHSLLGFLMDNQKTDIKDQESKEGNVTLQIDAQKLDAEFSKYTLDISGLKATFYRAFCGYRTVTKRVFNEKLSNISGKATYDIVDETKVDKDSRIINEAGADSILAQIEPAINQIATTSHQNKNQIYKLIKGKKDDIIEILAITYVMDNPYDLDIYRLSSIGTTITAQLISAVNKAKEGFTMKEEAEQNINSTIRRLGLEPTKQEGLADKLGKFFGNRG